MSDRIVVVEPEREFARRMAAALQPGRGAPTYRRTIRDVDGDPALAAAGLLVVSLDAAADTRALLEWLRAAVRPATRVLLVIPQHALPEATTWLAGRVDDFITRPLDLHELALRAKRLLAPPGTAGPGPQVGPLAFDEAAHAIRADGVILRLSPVELRLMVFLLAHPERAFTRAELLTEVWGEGVAITERTVDVTVRRLRSVLLRHGHSEMIQTVRGIGYRLAESGSGSPMRSKSTG